MTSYWQNGNTLTLGSDTYTLDTGQSTSTFKVFETSASSTLGFGITFQNFDANGVAQMVINVNDPADNTGNPVSVRNQTTGTTNAQSWYIGFVPTDTLAFYSSATQDASTLIGTIDFTNTNAFWGTSPPTGGGGGGSGSSSTQKKVFCNFW